MPRRHTQFHGARKTVVCPFACRLHPNGKAVLYAWSFKPFKRCNRKLIKYCCLPAPLNTSWLWLLCT